MTNDSSSIDPRFNVPHNQLMLRNFLSISILFICLLSSSPVWAQNGEQLAKSWCSSCHLFPPPQLLDKKTWIDNVLPEMGARLGFNSFRNGPGRPSTDTPDGIYPPEPLMDEDEWEQIIAWYEAQAPEHLALPTRQLRTRLDLFDIEVPQRAEHDFPVATAVFIDEISNRLLVGDSHELDLEIYTADLNLLAEVRSSGIVSRIRQLPSGSYLATVIGETIGQTEDLFGLLIGVAPDKTGQAPFAVNRLARRLHRPVDVDFGDFNNDGETDYVTAGFGVHSGKLTVHRSQPDGTLHETVLLDEAGSTSLSVAGDDLLVLIAQDNERIIRLKNFASGEPVTEETILRFPPMQGSSSMSVLDFNDDGIMDLLYTAGDNADISPIFKPYHGVYLYIGQPDETFKMETFFHLDGATSAVAKDFDQDGDMDIAAIAYYANINQKLDESGFVYLENNGDGFDAKYVEGIGHLGRFIAISAGDIDGDGDLDIALANLAFGPPGPMEITSELRNQWTSSTSFLLLRNGLR